MKRTGSVEMRCFAKLCGAVARLKVVQLRILWWLEGSAAQVKGASHRQNTIPHSATYRMAAQISTGTVHQRIMIFRYIVTGNLLQV